ncbi:3-oxoadipate enol-lactonase [Chryseobacterium sp. JM1]|uniref:3-oxoadipate enol-lactonase n=1 Tax=Chryseobacterium sp. JM1 TaxID=1233950 RepID=UPI0004E6071A|nr:3-oxoadipate enol-lactonase [Chryseobacterium sp. JM1]KFF21353.1 3-oxoadipate enol-lactonase [Chryseobacterium sp. JM1]
MPTIPLKNFDCHYSHEYFGQEETIVFSNSLGCDLSMWEENIDILSHHFNVLRYDTRGHGKSSINQDHITVKELAEDVIGLLDYLNLKKVIFCGLSMGGLIGQHLGIHYSSRFSKIILCNTAAKIGTREGWSSRIAQVTQHGLSSILDGTAERWFTEEYREKYPEKIKEILHVFSTNSLQGYTACCAAVRDADFREELRKLEVPAMIISGTKDLVTTIEDGNFLQREIPVSSHVSMRTAHLSNKENPEEFSKYIIFISEH